MNLDKLTKEKKTKLFDERNIKTTLRFPKHQIMTLKLKTEKLHTKIQDLVWKYIEEVALRPGKTKTGVLFCINFGNLIRHYDALWKEVMLNGKVNSKNKW